MRDRRDMWYKPIMDHDNWWDWWQPLWLRWMASCLGGGRDWVNWCDGPGCCLGGGPWMERRGGLETCMILNNAYLKGRDRIPIGSTFWKVPMLRGSSVLLPLIPCLSLCCLPCSSSRVGRSGPFLFIQNYLDIQFRYRWAIVDCNLHDVAVRSAVKGGIMERIMEEGAVEVGRKLSCMCSTGELSEFVIIDQGTGFLHRSTVWSRANNSS